MTDEQYLDPLQGVKQAQTSGFESRQTRSIKPSAVERGRLGGLKKGRKGLAAMPSEQRREIASLGGKARAKPTRCARCQKELPTARQAWMHCRAPRGAGKTG